MSSAQPGALPPTTTNAAYGNPAQNQPGGLPPLQNNYGLGVQDEKQYPKGGDYNPNQNVYAPGGPAIGMQQELAYGAGGYPGQKQFAPDPQPQQPANPYPVRAPRDVQNAVEGHKKWKGTNCLDCITKLKGDETRQGFVRKVFGILTAQTIFTCILCAIVLSKKSIEDWLQDNIWFYFVCFA